MSLSTAAIVKDGVIATTGGTSENLGSQGSTLNQHDLYFGGTTMSDRNDMIVKMKRPSENANTPGGYTQGRAEFFLKFPKILANSARTLNTARIVISYDVETTDVEKDTILSYLGDMFKDGSTFNAAVKNLSVE